MPQIGYGYAEWGGLIDTVRLPSENLVHTPAASTLVAGHS
jgi:hypothetical protein